MRIGALLGPVGKGTPASGLAEQARRLAAEGYTSLWSAQAIGRGFMLTDPFVALSVAAAAAPACELGTAVLQAPLYHPMDLAHRVFSLQQVCDNRLLLGVGAGSTRADFEAYGQDYDARFSTFEERVSSLRQIFSQGGTGGSNLSPWPSVAGGPPLFFGTWGKGVTRAAAEFDGWIASAHYRTADEVIAAHEQYRAARGSRAVVSTIQITGKTDLGELAEKLQRFAAAGFDDAVVMFLPGSPSPEAVRKLVSG